jgi:hypothetical protein
VRRGGLVDPEPVIAGSSTNPDTIVAEVDDPTITIRVDG